MSRFENKILGNRQGLQALDGVLERSIDPLLKREGKVRLILDLDSSEDSAHGRQEGVNYNGHWSSPQKVVHLLVWEINPIRNMKGGLKWLRKDTNPKKS